MICFKMFVLYVCLKKAPIESVVLKFYTKAYFKMELFSGFSSTFTPVILVKLIKQPRLSYKNKNSRY